MTQADSFLTIVERNSFFYNVKGNSDIDIGTVIIFHFCFRKTQKKNNTYFLARLLGNNY